ncbi:molecular chaperone [Aggregatibacter actinomycetemcomitans]|uniref:TorD/DmsD family molecular chaperone n=1 Tax=Aggregatibacter actinomycetemcomitans TaxID=714 RepID=UPI00197BCCCC|nr:molecular chaperone [Aggregatibacter actinomycetemcomitans]MBN6074086.1 molecular chaperone [Aggregatibacter actinomycetemcomitans]
MQESVQLNNFSLISRLFGNLFYRQPTDPILSGVFAWLQQGNLSQVWALNEDSDGKSALDALQIPIDLKLLNQEYQKLFGESGSVATQISAYDISVEGFKDFRQMHNLPEADNIDHFAMLLLTASWLEDNTDSLSAQQELFERFLLPCAAKFLAKVEKQATLPFYRALAYLTREMLSAMADELDSEEL